MENRFQEALDTIETLSSNEGDGLRCCIMPNGKYDYNSEQQFENAIDTLQELIDNYSKLEKALDKLLNMCTEDDVCCLSHNCPNIEYDFDEGICLGKCPTKEELKEYLLKGEQDGN